MLVSLQLEDVMSSFGGGSNVGRDVQIQNKITAIVASSSKSISRCRQQTQEAESEASKPTDGPPNSPH